jgi:hypothetical protein
MGVAMGWRMQRFDSALGGLNRTVAEAVAFFTRVDDQLSDGQQTARQVLAHLVFWHREYAEIARHLAQGTLPELRTGTFAELNAEASREFGREPMTALAVRLAFLQKVLDRTLRRLPHWRIAFPAKVGGKLCSVEERIVEIEAHIRNHVAHLQRAERATGGGRVAPQPDLGRVVEPATARTRLARVDKHALGAGRVGRPPSRRV